MTRSSHTQKRSSGEKTVEDGSEEILTGIETLRLRGIEKLKNLGEGLAEVKPDGPKPAMKRRFAAPEVAEQAGQQLADLVHSKLDCVSAVTKKDSGWQVVVNLIELSRIPHSTDVLASYDVILDAEGNLESYRRGSRYMRDQLGPDL